MADIDFQPDSAPDTTGSKIDFQPDEPLIKLNQPESIFNQPPKSVFNEENPLQSAIRSSMINPLEGTARFGASVLESMTSPMNLGLSALTLGAAGAERAGLAGIARFLKAPGQLAAGVQAAKGVHDMWSEDSLGGKAGGLLETGMGIGGLGVLGGEPHVATPSRYGRDASNYPKFTLQLDPQGSFPGWTERYNIIDPRTGKQIVKGSFTREEAELAGKEISEKTYGPYRDPQAQLSPLSELIQASKSVRASVNFHAPLRQALPLIGRKEWWTSLDDMVKAWGSEGAYTAIRDEIMSRPNFMPAVPGEKSIAEKLGLQLTDTMTRPEEAFLSETAKKIPGVLRSQRGYTTFLNKLRADTFDALISHAQELGRDPINADTNLGKQIAGFVNNATGRGSLGSMEKYATALNNTLFSPRLLASRVQLMNPAYYVNADPLVRREALKAMLSATGIAASIGELARMGGASIEDDPNSSDFRKIKIGNVRLDPYGGFQQYMTLFSRLTSGQIKSSTTGNTYDIGNRTTMKDVIENFGANKLSPAAKVAYDLVNQSKKRGFDIPEQAVNMFVPMFMQDIYEIAKERPDLLPITVPATLMGAGQLNYGQ